MGLFSINYFRKTCHTPRDALECVTALARTREGRQNCVRFAYRGPQVDRIHVLELERNVK